MVSQGGIDGAANVSLEHLLYYSFYGLDITLRFLVFGIMGYQVAHVQGQRWRILKCHSCEGADGLEGCQREEER